MLIGLAGTYGSGKGEVAEFLRGRSFRVHSLSDVLREELSERGLTESRDTMIRVGTELRAARGESVLADRVLSRLKADRNYAIDSIRHPAEVEAFRQARPDFRLVWVDADPAVRVRRLVERARPGDPTSLEELRALEGRELASDDPAGQQLFAVRDAADFRIENDASVEALRERVREILKQSLYFDRPDWDDYFMSIARVVATRSNCVKRKVAAVITLDRRIISTGYNGTPRGTTNCNEGGCPRCNAFAEEGAELSDCLCSHAEENAITQAAYHGVSVRGGTLYTTLSPCLMCTKMIINSGIQTVVFMGDYPLGDVSRALLREADVETRRLHLA